MLKNDCEMNNLFYRMYKKFCPGPITFILKLKKNTKDLENSINEYQKLLKINNLIEKKFQNTSKQISQTTKEKVNKLLGKENEKKIK